MLPRSLPSPLLCFPLSLSLDPPTRFRFRFRFPIACPPPIDWHCQTAIEHLEFFVRISVQTKKKPASYDFDPLACFPSGSLRSASRLTPLLHPHLSIAFCRQSYDQTFFPLSTTPLIAVNCSRIPDTSLPHPAASSTAPVAARRPLTSSPALDSGTWPPFPAPSAPKESQARPDFDELSISP
ncbi:hypothetical protein CPAR01_12448 [Colletotrichum paranaense]|uniref:Uncharacterized protein n=1 Tax=Colletotrichum paranaense TaxID=1914294 RepID=A0ABQ9S7H5_9PEZI|nr:uncharacterized protein CPAR01_12448 [Colletotrichum paranaense]KAK1527890.1 hypothetical protein CPAR01_12448 [Colletotrichum paranaense]